MIKILILSLIMVQIAHYSIQQLQEVNIDKNRIIKVLYALIPLSVIMLYMKHGLDEKFLRYSILICFLIVISTIDYYTMYIYDITIISGIIIQGIVLLITKSEFSNHIIGLLIGFIIPYIMVKLTKGIGSGDIGVYALCCFCIGIDLSIYMIPISFIIGAIYGIYLLLIKGMSKKSYMPFAPCIFLATIIVILTQQNIMSII